MNDNQTTAIIFSGTVLGFLAMLCFVFSSVPEFITIPCLLLSHAILIYGYATI